MKPMKKPDFPADANPVGQGIPTLRELFIADEQPGEVDPATLAYLRSHPEIQQLINRQKALERLARERAEEIGKFCQPDSDGTDGQN